MKKTPILTAHNTKLTKSYVDYMRSPRWREKSRACLEAAGRRCQRCKKRKAVNAHHLTYDRLQHERPEDLIALCRICHDEAHGVTPEMRAAYKKRNKLRRMEAAQQRLLNKLQREAMAYEAHLLHPEIREMERHLRAIAME